MSTRAGIVVTLSLVAATSACGTPQALVDSAQLSHGYLAELKTKSEAYLKDADRRVETRMDSLRRENDRAEKNEALITQERLIATAGVKKLISTEEEMRKAAAEFGAKDATHEGALKAYEAATLAPIKQRIAFPSQSFKKAEEGIAQLGEEQSFSKRAAFILAYARAVKAKYDDAKGEGKTNKDWKDKSPAAPAQQ